MRLDPLCEMELRYREGDYGTFLLVRPYGGQDGSGYGEGDGIVRGERLRGTLRWVNHPRRRGDGAMLPETHGVIRTDDGAVLLFSFRGRTTWVLVNGSRWGSQLLSVLFETEAPQYRWLNDTVCILEGAIDSSAIMRARVFACQNELVPAPRE